MAEPFIGTNLWAKKGRIGIFNGKLVGDGIFNTYPVPFPWEVRGLMDAQGNPLDDNFTSYDDAAAYVRTMLDRHKAAQNA